jgi:hypothetical protein
MFVATGDVTNTLAYSYDGLIWIGIGKTVFTTTGYRVAWGGDKWIAVGTGGMTVAYSIDGITWTNASSGTSIFTTEGRGIAWNAGKSEVYIQHPVIAVGQGSNTIAYSVDGLRWTGLGSSIFTVAGNGVAWNGMRWVAVGSGTNSLAYSVDGLRWTGLGTSLFTSGKSVAWNGTMWVAVGSGANSIAYSYDGNQWFGLGIALLMTGNGITWSGNQWIAVGTGLYSVAYSADGINWTGSTSATTLMGVGMGIVAWSGNVYVAMGNSAMIWSTDSITWNNIASPPFTVGRGATSIGSIMVAVGNGANTLAYSYNGTIWTANGSAIFTIQGNDVCWTGARFVAVGTGTNTIAYSRNGITWYPSINGNSIFTQGNGIAGNSRIGPTVVDSQLVLNRSDTLSILSDSYYNKGYTTFSASIQTQQV